MNQIPDIKAIQDILRDLVLNELLPIILRAIQPPEQTDGALLSRHDAAKLLGVSVQTIAALISDGALDHVRVRRRVLIPRRSLLDYTEKRSLPTNGDGAL